MSRNTDLIFAEIRKAAAEAPRMYFAPLIGAVRGIRSQYRALGGHKRNKKPVSPIRG